MTIMMHDVAVLTNCRHRIYTIDMVVLVLTQKLMSFKYAGMPTWI